jgi:poly-gamma-glutamate synthesis protein (capsule biosynthesis protein)
MALEIALLFAGDFISPERVQNIYSEELLCVLKRKDFSIVNLEAPLTEQTPRIRKTGKNFKSSPEGSIHIKDGYFDAVALSNNHIRDFGDQGVLDTINMCKGNNIKSVGAGKDLSEARIPLKIMVKGKRISFLNYSEREFNIATEISPGANPYNTISAFYDINREKNDNDFLIVIYHGGIENQYYPTPEIVKNFKFMIDVGADCIVSHHTHRYSGVIMHKNKPIFFGLGNFLASTKTKSIKEWQIGLIGKVILVDDKIEIENIPIKISSDFRTVDIISGSEKESILNHVNEISTNINNTEYLKEYWDKENERDTERIIRILKSNSFLEYRLRKYLPQLFRSGLNKYKSLNLLNMVRCESHRERLCQILGNLYKTDKK